MHIVRIPTYTSTGKLSHTAILLQHSYRDEHGIPRKRTLLNLTHMKPEKRAAIELFVKYQRDPAALVDASTIEITHGASIGVPFVIRQIADRLGISGVLGDTREGKLCLYQVMARVIDQGSRLSSIRLAKDYNMTDVLGIGFSFTEDHLYANLAYISQTQKDMEKKLFTVQYKGTCPSDIFLYDVTSSYFEGECNAFGEYGYNRDKKKGKKQVVMGLLCTRRGDPVGVDLFAGNTSDISTFASQTEKVKKTFGCARVTFVTDRGIIKGPQMQELETDDCFYITALTKAQIEKLLREDVLQLGLFDQTLGEKTVEGKRLIFRRNPKRMEELQIIRERKYDSVNFQCAKMNQYLSEHPKAKPLTKLRELTEILAKLKLNSWVQGSVKDRIITLIRDEDTLREESQLDGCYCMKTNLPSDVPAATIHERYKDLGKVEMAFRTEKTSLLELRPWYVTTRESSLGHAFVTMLAYKIVRYLKEAWRTENLTVEEGLRKLRNVSTDTVKVNGIQAGSYISTPDTDTKRLLKLINVSLPKSLPGLGAHVVSRKKLQSERK